MLIVNSRLVGACGLFPYPPPPPLIQRERGHEVVEAGKTTTPVSELLSTIGEYEGLIVRSGTTVTKEVIMAGKKLRVIGRAGVGVDNIDVPAATQRGVVVMNTPGGNTTSAAELSISLIMALARNIPQAVSSLKGGRWDRAKYIGSELGGKTLGIVGLGRIGRDVAKWAASAGMHVVGYDPVLAHDVAVAAGITPVTLDQLWERSDYITLHAPKTPDTADLICAANLAKCKNGVRIVNVARGGIVNEADLFDALESGKVGGAALDVYRTEPPEAGTMKLLAHANVICTPHLGASTNEAQINVARDIAVQMADALDNAAFEGVVNASNLSFLSRPELTPATQLAERLGSLQAQLMGVGGKLKRIGLVLEGPLVGSASAASALKTAVLKGLLSVTHGAGAITWVNVAPLAAELGIEVSERVSPKATNYLNTVTVTFESESGESRTTTAAVQSNNDVRLVAIDGFNVDIFPGGEMLFFKNEDKPGVLARVTAILGKHAINIAHFGLGRATATAGGDALGVIVTDAPVPVAVQADIAALDAVKQLLTASLPAAPSATPVGVAFGFGLRDDFAASGVRTAHGAPKPTLRPSSASFGSGPTKKRPGWTVQALAGAAIGRSHRSKLGKDKLKHALDKTRELLALPPGYHVGIVPASDTGAFEMAMWSLLGPRPVDSIHFESFGSGWQTDLSKQLKLKDHVELTAPYGKLPDLTKVRKNADVLFTWNGTTSGVMVPNADWISADREGLTFADATSAVFSQPVDFPKCDVVTYSWQKVLGGEGAHGMLILSPRAVQRLESYVPPWPMPKIFRMTKKGKFDESIFKGDTINTPSVRENGSEVTRGARIQALTLRVSTRRFAPRRFCASAVTPPPPPQMICVEDYLDSLAWAEASGGVAGLSAKSNKNLEIVEQFVKDNDWVHFLCADKATRSNTSICLTLDLAPEKVKALTVLLEKEQVAFDIGSYRDAPAGLRIWGGATVENEDMVALMPWLKWAYNQVK